MNSEAQNTVQQEWQIQVPFPVFRISCTQCKANFSLIGYAGNMWVHQKPMESSPIFCPYCATKLYA